MRTTLDLDDELVARAKSIAVREKTSLTRLIEEGLRLRLQPAGRGTRRARRVRLPVFAGRGGLSAQLKDARSTRSLLEAADEV